MDSRFTPFPSPGTGLVRISWVTWAIQEIGSADSVQIEGPRRRSLVRVLLRPFQGLAEFLLQKPVAVLHGGKFAVEHIGGPGFVLVQPLEQGIKILPAGRRLFGAAMGQNLPGRRVDDQLRFALGATDGQLPGLAHAPIVPDVW